MPSLYSVSFFYHLFLALTSSFVFLFHCSATLSSSSPKYSITLPSILVSDPSASVRPHCSAAQSSRYTHIFTGRNTSHVSIWLFTVQLLTGAHAQYIPWCSMLPSLSLSPHLARRPPNKKYTITDP